MPAFLAPRTNPNQPSSKGNELAALEEDNLNTKLNAIGVMVAAAVGASAPVADVEALAFPALFAKAFHYICALAATIENKNNLNEKANEPDNIKMKLLRKKDVIKKI